MNKKKIGLFLIILSIVLQSTIPASADEVYLSDIVITNTKDHLIAYFNVNKCFTSEMNRAIESGLNTTFRFFITLYEKKDFWWDRKIVDVEVRHSIKYDNLKKNYEVRLSEQNNKTITVKNFEKAKRLMAEVPMLKVTPLGKLKEGGHYQIRMMAELDKIRLPFYLHHVLFFLSLWDFETDWYTVDFKY